MSLLQVKTTLMRGGKYGQTLDPLDKDIARAVGGRYNPGRATLDFLRALRQFRCVASATGTDPGHPCTV